MSKTLSQENMDMVMNEPHLVPIFDDKFDVQCLFDEDSDDCSSGLSGSAAELSDQDHQSVSAATVANENPAKQDKARSTINKDVEFHDKMGAEISIQDSSAPSGSRVKSTDQDHQIVPTAICTSASKKIVPQKKNPFQITVEVEVHHNPFMPPKDAIEDAAGSELAVNEPQDQNGSTHIGSDLEELALQSENDPHREEEGKFHDSMHPKEATKDSEAPSGLPRPTESEANKKDYPNGSAKNGSDPEKFVMENENNALGEEEGEVHENMYPKEATTEDTAGPLEFAAALNKPQDQNASDAIQSVIAGIVPEEFELLERHFKNPSVPGEGNISATEQSQIDTDVKDTSSVMETSV